MKRARAWQNFKKSFRANPRITLLYLVLRVIVIGIMVAQFLNGDIANVFLCLLTLVLFMIPSFVEKRIKIDMPDTLEVIVLIFIFAAEILGEIAEYFVNVPGWDTALHTATGFLAAAVGFAMIDILNRTSRFAFRMSPIFVALVAFCFSMTIGVVWEFFEFGVDNLLNKDMQKDTVVTTVRSVSLHPEGRNIPVVVTDIDETVIHGTVGGEKTEIRVKGYLDIGIYDTMKDLLVNFIGAVVFSTIGYFYVKHRGSGRNARFAERFILTRRAEEEDVTGGNAK